MKKPIKVVAAGMILGAGLFVNEKTTVSNENVAEAIVVKKYTTYENCIEFRKKFPNGVRKSKKTKDKRWSEEKGYHYKKANHIPVSAKKYKRAIKEGTWGMDMDKDGIACER